MPSRDKIVTRVPNEVLQEARLLRGWTQQEVANRIGTTTVNISRWERGVTSPSPYFRKQLCLLFEKDEGALGLFLAKSASQKALLTTTGDLPVSVMEKEPAENAEPAENVESVEHLYPVIPQLQQRQPLRKRGIFLTVISVAVAVLVTGSSLLILVFFLSQHAYNATLVHFQTTATANTTTSLFYSFEDGGIDGWTKKGNVLHMQSSNQVGGYEGSRALQVILCSRKNQDEPFISVNPANNLPQSGQVLSMAVFMPSQLTPDHQTKLIVEAKLFVLDLGDNWHMNSYAPLQTGKWQLLTYRIPSFSGPAIQIGVQFKTWPYNVPTTVYIDAVQWK